MAGGRELRDMVRLAPPAGRRRPPEVKMEELGKKEKNVEEENVGTISTTISMNSTFHKNVVTFLKNVGRILKREKYCTTL
jgi:hypothetical protein